MFEEECKDIIEAYAKAGRMITTAESCTGGLLSGMLTQIPGSSAVFDRGYVTYSYPSKTELLGVKPSDLAEFGAVSEKVARAMAEGALARSNADVAVSITGVAGPGASEAKPEGLVYLGLALDRAPARAIEKRFGAIGRQNVRQASVAEALKLLIEAL